MTEAGLTIHNASPGFPAAAAALKNFGLKFTRGGAHFSRTMMLPELGTELLRDAVKRTLKNVSLQQGRSRYPRKISLELSSARPTSGGDEVTVWMRDGWNDDVKTVWNDARAAGVSSPLPFGYLPRLHHEELRQAIASDVAAQETLDAHGTTGGPEASANGCNSWTPAVGTFPGWPQHARELKCLDPCMGSRHFVVAMFERLVALRKADACHRWRMRS